MLTRAPEKGHAVPDPFEPFVHTLPDAETVARRLGGRKAGENDWRIPSPLRRRRPRYAPRR